FRTSAATGEILLFPRAGGCEVGGVTVIEAIRLNAAARPGELLVDAATYAALPPELQHAYGLQERVRGRRDETFLAYRSVLGPQGVKGGPLGWVRNRLKRLTEGQLQRLMILTDMPPSYRPPPTLPSPQKRARVWRWAQASGRGGVERLK